ncbi:FAD-binding oxidoreductase, putative [Rhizoctonia solani AG-3 Rhs1AP]|uniref:FAD-binding oxidoreductase, putative n=2 Tax=Rhizoctonia solani AG-3 TaxID=1086053 RepID=X8JHX3_9AGAM|nr:FAD-binding oxidoreductase, putative [Rhizoctonia solani AG-3 Rhs1AP]KEP50908.1 putative FAD-binding oxidoreductase [Rhizoctonia solani 123E]
MSPINSSALELLRKALSSNASVNLPGDPEYTNKRWARNAEKTAAVVTCPVTAEDVAQIIEFSQGNAPYDAQPKLDLAVKGGGHTPSGASSSEGGIVIDLNPKMHSVRVDPEAKLAYVQGGALWGDVDEATFPHGLASVSGVVSHTGVGGLILGGGFGWLCSQHGLVVDNLVQATVVTSLGKILTASDSENPDLFWAIRGGGANFGVVTEFVLKLHEQRSELWGGMLIYPPTIFDKLVPEVNSWLAERTPVENIHLAFMSGPSGPAVGLQIVYNGDADTGAKKFERFVKLEPIMGKLGSIPYLQLNRMQDPFAEHGSYRMLQGNFIPSVPTGLPLEVVSGLFSLWLKIVTENPVASTSVIMWELYHPGAFSSVPKDATAYRNRAPTYNIGYFMNWSDPAWTEQSIPTVLALDKEFVKLRDAHFPPDLVVEGGYINYQVAESQKGGTSRRFGSHFPRLAEIKRKYDPENLFGKWFVPAQA